jgi:Tfp pilus assembly protein PilF
VSRRRGVLAMLTIVLALGGCAGTSTPAPVQDTREFRVLQARAAYERGLTSLRDGQPGQALTALQEAVRLDPTVALYANTLGVVLLELRQVEGALAWLARAVELDPQYGDAQLNYAIALAESGQWERAVDGYKRALRLPTLTTPQIAHQNLGVALHNLKRDVEAEQSLRFALSLEPSMIGTHYNLGLVLLALGRRDEAVAAFQRERQVAPPDSPFARAAQERLQALGQGG